MCKREKIGKKTRHRRARYLNELLCYKDPASIWDKMPLCLGICCSPPHKELPQLPLCKPGLRLWALWALWTNPPKDSMCTGIFVFFLGCFGLLATTQEASGDEEGGARVEEGWDWGTYPMNIPFMPFKFMPADTTRTAKLAMILKTIKNKNKNKSN